MKPSTILRHVGYLDERARVCHTIPHSKSNISVLYLRVMDGDNNEGGVRGKLASCVSYDRTAIIEQDPWEPLEEPPAFLSEIQGHLPQEVDPRNFSRKVVGEQICTVFVPYWYVQE